MAADTTAAGVQSTAGAEPTGAGVRTPSGGSRSQHAVRARDETHSLGTVLALRVSTGLETSACDAKVSERE